MTDEAQPNQPVPDSQRLPWEREQGWAGSFFTTSVKILRRPSQAFSLRPAGAYYKPWLYAWLVTFACNLFMTFMLASISEKADINAIEEALTGLVGEMLLAFAGLIGLGVWGWLIHYFAKSKATAQAPRWATWRALAYSHAAMLLVIPLGLVQMALYAAGSGSGNEFAATLMMLTIPVFLAIVAYGVYLQCVGLDCVHGCGKGRAFLAIVQSYFALTILIGCLFAIVLTLFGLGGMISGSGS